MSVENSLDVMDGFDIYMARVGQSAAMAEGRLAGNLLNDNPLSAKGIQEAEGAGETLVSALKANNINDVQIYTADHVLRMKQTTDLIIKKLEEAKITYSRHSDACLGGRDHGISNGLTWQERQESPEVLQQKEARKAMTREMRFMTAPQGGESKQDLVNKISQFFQRIFKGQNPFKPIVVVTSNNTIGALTAFLNKETPYKKILFQHRDILQLRQVADRLNFIMSHKA